MALVVHLEEVGDALMKWLPWSPGTTPVVGCDGSPWVSWPYFHCLLPVARSCRWSRSVLSWQGYYQGLQDVWGSIWRGKTGSDVYGFFFFLMSLAAISIRPLRLESFSWLLVICREDFTAGRPEEGEWAGSWIWNPLSDDDGFGVLPPVALFLFPGPELILLCAGLASIAVSAFSVCPVRAPPTITLHW